MQKQYLPFIRLVVSTYDAFDREDLEQEGLWGLYLACCGFDPARGVPFDAFVKVCIRNRILSAWRSLNRQRPKSTVPLEDCPPVAAPEEEPQALFDTVRRRLSPLEKKVLALWLEGKNGGEIAAALGITPKSADNAMTRVKNKIRALPDALKNEA